MVIVGDKRIIGGEGIGDGFDQSTLHAFMKFS